MKNLKTAFSAKAERRLIKKIIVALKTLAAIKLAQKERRRKRRRRRK